MPTPSKSEASLAFALTHALGVVFETEHRFHNVRRWRADFAIWPDNETKRAGILPLLVEIEGAKYGSPGRHQRVDGIDRDCEKYAEAMCLGYHVLRLSARMVRDGRALGYIERMLKLVFRS